MDPITLYSHTLDLLGTARRLRKISSNAVFDGPDHAWSNAIIELGGVFNRKTVAFSHHPTYEAEPNWSRRMKDLSERLSGFAGGDRRVKAAALTHTFQSRLCVFMKPELRKDGDPRLKVVYEVASFLDGVLFSRSALRDAMGRILVSAKDESLEDPDAVWPKNTSIELPRNPIPTPGTEEADPATEFKPPTPQRVARRALVLATLALRAWIDEGDDNDADYQATLEHLHNWVEAFDLKSEFEPKERYIFTSRLGGIASQDRVDSMWRIEGLSVLAWALKRFQLPAHDELIDPQRLHDTLGVFDWGVAEDVLQNAELRSHEELVAEWAHLLGVHWRLRKHRRFDRRFRIQGRIDRILDFKSFAKEAPWLDGLDFNKITLIDGDLNICGVPIYEAQNSILDKIYSAAMERHQAASWLIGWSDEYSKAPTDT